MPPLSIRSSTIRLGIFISTLIIAFILIFQLIWLKIVYRDEQNEFDHSVIKAIRGLYEDIEASTYYSTHLNDLIEHKDPQLFLAHIDLPVNADSLSGYLHYELEDFGIFTDCHLGIYSAESGGYIHSTVLRSAGSHSSDTLHIPDTPKAYDHLTLYFPHRRRFIISQMNFWTISSAVLLFVLLLFSASLYYFYRQKFLNETQKDFIQNFAHEFKTPVAVISLAADVLKNPSIIEKPQKLDTYAGIVKYQSDYLSTQIEKLLKFANTEARHLHLTKTRVSIHELIREAVANLTPLIEERDTKLSLELNAEDPHLIADKDYLIIVVTNLVDNAIKYSKQPRIRIKTENRGDRLIFSVRDNGIGIEKKLLNKVFQKFFRVRSEDTYTAKGFGLGLSFVKKIVAAHRGKIKIESIPDKGSEFTIELPMQ